MGQNYKGKVYFNLSNIDTAQELNNLRRVFLTIKKKTNEILSNYDDVNYLEDPSVDIKTIAKEIGISDILYVQPEEIYYLHAVLDDSDKERIIIKVNNDDSDEEKLFSIAHEIEHYIKKKADMLKKADVFKNTDFEKKDDVLRKAKVFFNRDALAARSSPGNFKEAIRIVKKIKHSKLIAGYIAETVSKNLGKKVFIEQAYKELAKVLLFYDSIHNNKFGSRSNEQFILNLINKLYDEEMADYFAANLLVPAERFILWEDKSDGKIAKVFKVSKACIKKRRKEIIYELDFITSKNISSGVNTE